MVLAVAPDLLFVIQAGTEAQAADPQPAVTMLPVTAEGDAATDDAATAQQAAAEAGTAAQQVAEAASTDPAAVAQTAVTQADVQSQPGDVQPQGETEGDAAAGTATSQTQDEVLPVEDFTSKTRQVHLQEHSRTQALRFSEGVRHGLSLKLAMPACLPACC